MTGDLINLNKARKAKARVDAKAAARTNRLKFGRAKAETRVQKLEVERAKRTLDRHRLDRDTPESRDTPEDG